VQTKLKLYPNSKQSGRWQDGIYERKFSWPCSPTLGQVDWFNWIETCALSQPVPPDLKTLLSQSHPVQPNMENPLSLSLVSHVLQPLPTLPICQIPIFSAGETYFFFGGRPCASFLFSQVPKKCTDLDLTLVLGTYSKFAWENDFLSPVVCFPQPCSSAGRRFATSRSHLQNYRRIFRFHNQNFDEMRCKLDSTENPRSFEKYPTPP